MHKSIPPEAAEKRWVFISGGYPYYESHPEYAFILGIQCDTFEEGLQRFSAIGVQVINDWVPKTSGLEGTWGICGPKSLQHINHTWMRNHPWHEGLPEQRTYGTVIMHLDDGRVFYCDQDENNHDEEE